MKKTLVMLFGAALGIALSSGCAMLEDNFKYYEEASAAGKCSDYREAYKKYQELAAAEENRREEAAKAGNAEEAAQHNTSHMAWLARSAELIVEEVDAIMKREGKGFRTSLFVETKTGDERRKFVATLTEMDKVLTEADANYKYFRNRGEDQRAGIDYKRAAEREAKKEISSSLSSYARDEEEKKLADEKKRRDAAAAAAAKAAFEKKLKDPAFLYPNRNICASSIKLYKDWKSGINRFVILDKEFMVLSNKEVVSNRSAFLKKEAVDTRSAILNEEVVNEPERLKLGGVEKRFFGIVDKTDMTGIEGRLTYIYGCGNEKKGAHAALIGVIIRPSDKTMTNDFIQKYRREMPKAKIRQFSKTVSKRNFRGWFERSVIEHVTVFQDGVKVVRVTRTETKTTYSKGFLQRSKRFQNSMKEEYYKEEQNRFAAAFQNALGIGFDAKFFNSANYDCNVKIYDEMQLNAYAKIRDASAQEAAAEERKARQKKLDF